MGIESLVFYIFSGLLIVASVLVVVLRNPVHSALSLVLAFFATTVLWILLQAEFLALILILVYVGAVMTLFLFVVMMLHTEVVATKPSFVKYLPIGVLLFAVVMAAIILAVGPSQFSEMEPVQQAATYSQAKILGRSLYTEHVVPFQLAGILLLVAIVAAISLTLRPLRDTKTIPAEDQIKVRREERVRLINMPPEHPSADYSEESTQ